MLLHGNLGSQGKTDIRLWQSLIKYTIYLSELENATNTNGAF